MKTLKTRKPRSFLSFSWNRFPLQSLANLYSLLHRSFKTFINPLIFPLMFGVCSSILKPFLHTCPLAGSWIFIFSSLHLTAAISAHRHILAQLCLDFVELFPVLPVQGWLACWMLSPLTMWGRSGTSFSRGVASRGGGCSAIISWDHSWTPAHLHLLQNKKRMRFTSGSPFLKSFSACLTNSEYSQCTQTLIFTFNSFHGSNKCLFPKILPFNYQPWVLELVPQCCNYTLEEFRFTQQFIPKFALQIPKLLPLQTPSFRLNNAHTTFTS